MNKNDFETSLIRQARVADEMIGIVKAKVEAQLDTVLPAKEIFDAQKIFSTGCGDSWLAGVAAKPAFEALTKVETNVMRAVDFSRHLNSKNLGYSPNTPLVIAISYSGEATRAVECAQRAAKYGANTLAITANPQSRLAKACRHMINVGLPEGGEYFPGGTTYIASMLSLMLLALRIGRAKTTISAEEYKDMKAAITDWSHEFNKSLPAMEDQCFDIAQRWKDLRCMDFIGDYAEYATAYFGSAKVIETWGGYTTYDDSEDWCHINYFLMNPETIGRVVTTNKTTPSFGRVKETINAIKSLGSPCMIVSDADASEFPEGMDVVTTVSPRYFWLNPLLQHIPFDMVAGYIAAMKDGKAFREGDPRFDVPELNQRLKEGTRIEIV